MTHDFKTIRQFDRVTDAKTAMEHCLYKAMSDISEECYCAGWSSDNECRLYSAAFVEGDNLGYGMGTIDPDDLETVRQMAKQTGCWVVYLTPRDDDGKPDLANWGPHLVSLEEFAAHFAECGKVFA